MVLFKCHAGWEYHDATHFFLIIRFTIRPVCIHCIPFSALRDLKNGMFKNSFSEVSSLFILQVYGKARDREKGKSSMGLFLFINLLFDMLYNAIIARKTAPICTFINLLFDMLYNAIIARKTAPICTCMLFGIGLSSRLSLINSLNKCLQILILFHQTLKLFWKMKNCSES
ncbi:unnamed protein product [Prunus armeniaca]